MQNLVNVAAVEKGITSNRRHADGKVSVVCPKTLGSSLGELERTVLGPLRFRTGVSHHLTSLVGAASLRVGVHFQ